MLKYDREGNYLFRTEENERKRRKRIFLAALTMTVLLLLLGGVLRWIRERDPASGTVTTEAGT